MRAPPLPSLRSDASPTPAAQSEKALLRAAGDICVCVTPPPPFPPAGHPTAAPPAAADSPPLTPSGRAGEMYHICPFFYSFFARFLRIFYRFSDPDGKLVRGYSETAGLAPLLPQRSLTEPQPEPEPEPDPRPLVGTVSARR